MLTVLLFTVYTRAPIIIIIIMLVVLFWVTLRNVILLPMRFFFCAPLTKCWGE